MQLNVVNVESECMGLTLGIDQKRIDYLYNISKEIGNKLLFNSDSDITSLSEPYKEIVSICDNIEEIVFCMHVFCFGMAKCGMLK